MEEASSMGVAPNPASITRAAEGTATATIAIAATESPRTHGVPEGALLPRITGSLSTVYLLLHIHVLPQQQQSTQQKQQPRRQLQLDASSISRGLTAGLLQHAGLLGAALLPFKVLSYDARLSFAVLKTDAASAPSLILAAANLQSIDVPAGSSSTSRVPVPCFATLVRTAATLHALACPRRPNATLLMQ